MKKIYIILIISISVLALFGCLPQKTNPPISKPSTEQQLSSVSILNAKLNVVRARGKSNYGELDVVCKDKEEVEQLGADSSYGKATDYSFTGDYQVIFKAQDGTETAVSTLNNLRIVQPENAIMELNKLTVGDTDIFYFIPEYSGSNDVPIRFFAITKEKKAFQFSVEDNKAQQFGDANVLSDSTAILSTTSKTYTPPQVVGKNNVALTAVYNIGEGQNYKIFRVIFNIDIKDKILKYMSKEEIKGH